MREAEDELEEQDHIEEHESSPPSDNHEGTIPSTLADDDDDDDDDDDADLFHNSLFGARGHLGLQSTLRALSGMMSGMSSRLRDILNNLRMKDDPSIQLIALQELSELLLVSNEDNLSGQFSPDPYVKELVALMQPNDFGEENPEIMLLACRCLANLMEALRGSVANVVYGGAVPVLCQKLLDIQFIDLAEQALSVSYALHIIHTCTLTRYAVDSSEDFGRLSCLDRAGRWFDSLSDLPRFLSYQHAAHGRDNCCQLLPQSTSRLISSCS